jgi:MinD superfamily P-loop ATPase
MTTDMSQTKWHGVPRKEILWFPVLDAIKCIGCELCYVTCGRGVYNMVFPARKAIVESPYNCMVGCSTCAVGCPSSAITFPPREVVHEIEKKYKIFQEVHKEAEEKRNKRLPERSCGCSTSKNNTCVPTVKK